MARLIAYSRICPAGLQWRGPAGTHRATWAELGAGPPDAFGLPPLRAKYFFDEPFPKFGRMDPLCKVAVAAAQLIQRAGGFEGRNRDEIAQSGGTALGCLEVDAQFEATRRAGAPSPALFVYTLPSMFQGEVAIQFKLRGRCALFCDGERSGITALATAAHWVDHGRAPAVLAIACDAAGPAAQAAGFGPPQTAAMAWLLAANGKGPEVTGPALRQSAATPHRGDLRHGLTFMDTLEAWLTPATAP
ncbi:MAG: hypothetical protein KF754_08670 [Planctomycetes bacterium]|nr:hypothetical protein [Planctomycetota bacterium]